MPHVPCSAERARCVGSRERSLALTASNARDVAAEGGPPIDVGRYPKGRPRNLLITISPSCFILQRGCRVRRRRKAPRRAPNVAAFRVAAVRQGSCRRVPSLTYT